MSPIGKSNKFRTLFFTSLLRVYIALALALSPMASAQDTPKQTEPEATSSPLSVFLTGGATFGANSFYTITAGNIVSAADEASGVDAIVGGEVNYRFSQLFQLGAVIEYSRYERGYSRTDDSEYGFYLVPRFEKHKGISTFWAGLGIGLVDTLFGQTLGAGTLDGALIESNAVGFAISPRIGVDFDIGKGSILGMQGSFTDTWASFSGTAGGAFGFGIPLHIDMNRRWFALSARVGLNF